ncbi:MAG: DNA-processing protein DprA [Armatimonadota bacterium]|nr:DNA-processing protein DprA [Armatimonadota bacterium]
MLQKVVDLGIRIITVCDNIYPATLKAYQHQLPPVIYAYGNTQLLQERRFAVVNSATISNRSTETTSDIASFLMEEGLIPVTGHNNPPYQTVLLAAKRRSAPVVVVLDRGIINAFHGELGWQPVAAARIWDPEFDPDKDLIISQFRLGDHWIGENSKLRDRMVFGLSDAVIACEIRPGGVMEKECMFAKNRGRELYVCSFADGEPEGNKALLCAGCRRLDVIDAKSQLISMCISPTFEGKTDDMAKEGETE